MPKDTKCYKVPRDLFVKSVEEDIQDRLNKSSYIPVKGNASYKTVETMNKILKECWIKQHKTTHRNYLSESIRVEFLNDGDDFGL